MPEPLRPERALSRRAFVRRAAGTGLAAAAAGTVLGSALPGYAAGGARTVARPFSSDLYASPDPQRFTLVLQRGTADGIRFVSGPSVQVRFRAPGGEWQPFTKLRLDTAGLPKNRGVYRTEAVFDQAGAWDVQARVQGTTSRFAQPVAQDASGPVPGEAAPRVASPTTTDALGVDPICTREPQCPLHSVSLADVIGSGRPVAVLFATPALCTSAYCGPVLDEMLRAMRPYEDRVTFVHVDIYKSLGGSGQPQLSPTVAAWGIPSEPWLYGIDGAGVVRSRLDTAFGRAEMVELFDGLVAPG